VSHYLKGYAKRVKRALEQDETIERPIYTWCLEQVIKHFDTARGSADLVDGATSGAVVDELVKLIRPSARKVGAPLVPPTQSQEKRIRAQAGLPILAASPPEDEQ